MIEEIWKDIEGYENLYQVSTMGNVKSLNFNKTSIEKILKPRDNGNGYLTVCLWKNNAYKHKYIHRLVCETFLPNPENKPCIDHVNCVRSDNRLENLRWATYTENLTNPITRKRNSDTHREIYQGENNPNYGNRGKLNSLSKPIVQLDLFGNIINLWHSAKDAERECGFDASTITKCCKGKKQTHKGFKWMYLDIYLADWWEQEMEKEVA